jgi:hypothetical protein
MPSEGLHMEVVIPLSIVGGSLVAFSWFFHNPSGRPARPLSVAATWTLATAIHLVGGLTGYNLNAADANAAGTHWTGTVIWWEVGVGLALLPLAIYYWRKGLRSLTPAPQCLTRAS